MPQTLKRLALLAFLAFSSVSALAADEDNFTIRSGDVLQVTVWKEEGMDRELVVLPDGTITFPLIGTITVQDMTPNEVEVKIKEKLKKLIPDASVAVVVKAALGHTVNVIGQVQKPGEIVMGHHLTVMQALSQAGGLTPFASENHIKILRRVNGAETSIRFPYSDVADGDHLEKNIELMPGDVVVVPTGGIF